MTKPQPPEVIRARQRKRFYRKTRRAENGCLEWVGHVMPNGYGQARYHLNGETKLWGAHVAAWIIEGFPYDPNLDIGHRCHDEDKRCIGGWKLSLIHISEPARL